MLWRFIVAAGLVGSLALAEPAAARPFTAKDLAMLDRVSDPQLSPDGRYLAFSVRATDWAANHGVGEIWMTDRRAPTLPPRPLMISEKPAVQPRWSPDGRTLYFLSARTGVQQVWRTDADGAVATPVTDLPIHVSSYRLSPDGRTLVVAVNVFPDCDTLLCTKQRQDARRTGQVSAQGFDRLPLFIWDDWQAGERMQLFAIKLDADGVAVSAPVPLMKGLDTEAPDKPFGDDSDYAVTNTEVIFSALEAGRPWGGGAQYRLFHRALDGGGRAEGLAGLPEGSYGKPTLSPDGTRLAYLARKISSDDARSAVMVRDLKTGSSREADAGFDRSAEALKWSPDGKTIYATMGDLGRTRLFAIDLAGGKPRVLTAEGQVSGFTAAGGRLVVARDSLMAPAQLYEIPAGGGEVQLTRQNEATLRDFAFAKAEQFSFPGWNGETVYGYVLPPSGYKPGKKYPVAFLIHGGPHGSFGDAWSYRWNPQVWAGMGFAVVMIDFHGSSGYGEAFAHSIVGHWGDRPLEDLQKGWAAAQAKYSYLDGARACALGGSYGGYMVAWIAGVWNSPWKCLVDHDGVFETRTMALTTDIPGFSEYETNGLVWDHAEDYDRFNPINHLADWKTPLLVIHGGKDFRVPLGQGLGAFTAAQRKGVPSRFVYYPDENHWVLKPQNSVEWYRNVEAWMRKWLDAPAGTADR